MIKILDESIQDVEAFLKNDVIDMIKEDFPEYVKDPASIDEMVAGYVVGVLNDMYPDEIPAFNPQVAAVKVLGDETEFLTTDHYVVKFNGYFYDYTAHQFTEEYSGKITIDRMPVVQRVLTDDSQINDGVSTVKSYALVEI